jgi:hypothetical protein
MAAISPTSESGHKEANAAMVSVSARQDDELRDWVRWAETNGTSFVRAIAGAAFVADIPHYLLLRPVLLKLKEEYPRRDLRIVRTTLGRSFECPKKAIQEAK